MRSRIAAALLCVCCCAVLLASIRGIDEQDDVLNTVLDQKTVDEDIAKAVVKALAKQPGVLQALPSEIELRPDAANSNGCVWTGSAWQCTTEDYDLRVIYPPPAAAPAAAAPSTIVVVAAPQAPPPPPPPPSPPTPPIEVYLPPVVISPLCAKMSAVERSKSATCNRRPAPLPASRRRRRAPAASSGSASSNKVQKSRMLRKAGRAAAASKRVHSRSKKRESSSSTPKRSTTTTATTSSRSAGSKKMLIAPVKQQLAVQSFQPKIHPPPLKEPWSPPENVYLFWGPLVDKWETAENVRHLIKLGTIQGGEYRDSRFIFSFRSQEFRDMTLTCCKVLLFPPLQHGFPIFADNGRMEHRISRFVSNGNTMIFTGLTAVLFINRIFHYNLEMVSYSPGPFRPYERQLLPPSVQKLKRTLLQDGMHVTVVEQRSMPIGTQILYASPMGSPFFIIKYCEVNNPKPDLPPIKVFPRDCPKWAKRGSPCGCGNIIYLGYDFHDPDNERWNNALLSTLELVIGTDEE